MKENLSQAYQALLRLNVVPEELVAYERNLMIAVFGEWLKGSRKIGWYLLNDGTSVAKCPLDSSQISGIWISQYCVLSPQHSLNGLLYHEAKTFCASLRINGFPLRMSDHSRIVLPRFGLINMQLTAAGFPPLQQHARYWSDNGCQTSDGKTLREVRDFDCWEASCIDVDSDVRALCFAVLDLSFLQD